MLLDHLLKYTENGTGFDCLCTLYKYSHLELAKIANDAKNLVFCAEEILEIVR